MPITCTFHLCAKLVQQPIEKILFENYKKNLYVLHCHQHIIVIGVQICHQCTQITLKHPAGAWVIFWHYTVLPLQLQTFVINLF